MLVQARKQLNELILMVGPEKFLYLMVWTPQKDWQLTGSTARCTGQIKGVCCLQRVNSEDAPCKNSKSYAVPQSGDLAFSNLIILHFFK